MLTYGSYNQFYVLHSFEPCHNYIRPTIDGYKKLLDFYACTFFMTTYRQMCITENYTIDISKTIRFYKRLHHIVEALQFHFGNTPVHLPPVEKELHKDIYNILKEHHQFKQMILLENYKEMTNTKISELRYMEMVSTLEGYIRCEDKNSHMELYIAG